METDEWPDESVSSKTFSDLSEQRAEDLYQTAVEMYQIGKNDAIPPKLLLDDFEEFIAVVNNTRQEN